MNNSYHDVEESKKQKASLALVCLETLQELWSHRQKPPFFSKKFALQLTKILLLRKGYSDGWSSFVYAVYKAEQFSASMGEYIQDCQGKPLFALFFLDDHWIAMTIIWDYTGAKAYIVDSEQDYNEATYMEIQYILHNFGIGQFYIHRYVGSSEELQTYQENSPGKFSSDKQYSLVLALENLLRMSEVVLSMARKEPVSPEIISQMAFSRQEDILR